VGGCCLLVAIMRRLHLDNIIVSTHNLLDGVVREAMFDAKNAGTS
jgi:exopolyphosphatase/pppGpp-phosphohydrolase